MIPKNPRHSGGGDEGFGFRETMKREKRRVESVERSGVVVIVRVACFPSFHVLVEELNQSLHKRETAFFGQ